MMEEGSKVRNRSSSSLLVKHCCSTLDELEEQRTTYSMLNVRNVLSIVSAADDDSLETKTNSSLCLPVSTFVHVYHRADPSRISSGMNVPVESCRTD